VTTGGADEDAARNSVFPITLSAGVHRGSLQAYHLERVVSTTVRAHSYGLYWEYLEQSHRILTDTAIAPWMYCLQRLPCLLRPRQRARYTVCRCAAIFLILTRRDWVQAIKTTGRGHAAQWCSGQSALTSEMKDGP
jgi:hypothetical protein